MSKIYYPVLCINGTHEINVTPGISEAALFEHCYELQKLHWERIEGFFIYPVEDKSDREFVECINIVDNIRMQRDTLALHTTDNYARWLLTLNKEALEVLLNELLVQVWARNN